MNIQNLETQYLKAKIAYYDGNPIMSDAAFDTLERELKSLGSKVIEQVGSKRKDFDFPHPTKMLSLAKIQTQRSGNSINYAEDEFMSWVNSKQIIIGHTFEQMHMFCSPKFDGSAINIIYRNNKLESVLTRGDGKKGKDVTDRFRKYLPEFYNEFFSSNDCPIVEIRCEVVMRKSIFKKKYASEFANARNIVAGIIGKDEIDDEKIADLSIIPIHLLFDGEHQEIKYVNEFKYEYPIFADVQVSKIRIIKEDYLWALKYWEENRESFEFQLDGVVFSLPIIYRKILGENDHDTEWAIAIKFVPDEVVSMVNGIEWNLGKTGELTPVVLLNPVELAGTTVKRASGYNAGYIYKNGIGVGAILSISKAGDIIPEIQEIKLQTPETFVLPSQCPSCKSKLKYDGIHLYCPNKSCKGKIAKQLAYATNMLDLKGIGGKTIEPFAEDYNNIFELMVAVLHGSYRKEFNIEKYGIKYNSRSHQIFQDAFTNIKSLTFDQVILMMGYDDVGKKLAEQVAKDYCDVEPDYKGHEKALIEMFQNKDIKSYILNAVSVLEHLGVHVDKPEVKLYNNVMKTIYVCMTGSPKTFGYKTKEEFISQFDNVEEVSITDSRCNYLITDSYDSTSNKMKNAEKKGVKIVTYGDFKI